MHVTALKRDYYQFDPVRHRLVGEVTKRSYQLGDRLQVEVARVDMEERKIDFDLIGSVGNRPDKDKKTRARKPVLANKKSKKGSRSLRKRSKSNKRR